jgi:hypothetical protein
LDLSVLQVLAFIPLLFLFSRFSVVGRRIPRSLLIFALIAATASASLAFNFRSAQGRSFLVSRLKDDNFETESRKLREELSRRVPEGSSVRAYRYYRSFAGIKAVEQFLKGNPDANAMVWGDRRWIRVSFAMSEPVLLSELGDATRERSFWR